VWHDGGEDVGAILPFQWRGTLFGAGAKRWILGDGMGLGRHDRALVGLIWSKPKRF